MNKKLDNSKQKYCKELTSYVKQVFHVWQENQYTGNMYINWNDGLITSFKPSLLYGISMTDQMMEIFQLDNDNKSK